MYIRGATARLEFKTELGRLWRYVARNLITKLWHMASSISSERFDVLYNLKHPYLIPQKRFEIAYVDWKKYSETLSLGRLLV